MLRTTVHIFCLEIFLRIKNHFKNWPRVHATKFYRICAVRVVILALYDIKSSYSRSQKLFRMEWTIIHKNNECRKTEITLKDHSVSLAVWLCVL